MGIGKVRNQKGATRLVQGGHADRELVEWVSSQDRGRGECVIVYTSDGRERTRRPVHQADDRFFDHRPGLPPLSCGLLENPRISARRGRRWGGGRLVVSR